MMPVRLGSFESHICSDWLTAVSCTDLRCDLWHIIWSVQLGPVNLLQIFWVLVSLHWLASQQARGSGSVHCSPTETLDSTQHTTTARRPPALPIRGIKSQQLRAGVTLGDRGNVQASKQNSQIFDFAIMGNHLFRHDHFYDLSLYWSMFPHIPSQGTGKALCKNSNSLCKLNSSGLSWPPVPPPLFFSDSQITL